MITPQMFYSGYPADGTVSSGNFNQVDVFDCLAQVPGGRTWRIEEITVTNMTQVTGYYSVAVLPGGFSNAPQVNMGVMNASSPPRSSRQAVDGNTAFETAAAPGNISQHRFLAYSQVINARTTRTMPIVVWALGGERLFAGAYPGAISLVGYGGICLTISGREYRT